MMARTATIKGHMTEKQRLQFTNAYMISSLKYGVQFLVGKTHSVRYSYHSATMMVARWVKGGYCFRTSCYQICKSIGWDIPSQQIMKEAIKFAHDIYISRRPIQILQKIRLPRTRNTAKLSLKYRKNNEKYQRNLIVQSISLYNMIPDDMKLLTPKRFKNALKKQWIIKPD